MNKMVVILLLALPFFDACHRERQDMADLDFEMPKYPDELFDSLMWLQYQCPDDEEKTVYEWSWAYDVRETLDVDDLDSLTTLCKEEDDSYHSYAESPSTSDMTTAAEIYAATARFRMLNAYQALAELTAETPLGQDADCYFDDYALWENLYKEFDERYQNTGNDRFMMLFSYYSHLADLRTDILLEELACLSEGRKTYPNATPPQLDQEWLKSHPAIRHWYDYRMAMANNLQPHDLSQAQSLRALTYKQFTRYVEYETEAEIELN